MPTQGKPSATRSRPVPGVGSASAGIPVPDGPWGTRCRALSLAGVGGLGVPDGAGPTGGRGCAADPQDDGFRQLSLGVVRKM